MTILFEEQAPKYIVCVPNGFMTLTAQMSIPGNNKLMNLKTTLQVKADLSGAPSPKDFAQDLDVYIVRAIKSNVIGEPLAAFPDEEARYTENKLKDVEAALVVIKLSVLQEVLEANYFSKIRALQHKNVIYKKINVELRFSRVICSITEGAPIESLQRYQNYRFTCPLGVTGTSTIPIMREGKLAFSLYPSDFTVNGPNTVLNIRRVTNSMDKPSRILIGGSTVDPETAIDNDQVAAVLPVFKNPIVIRPNINVSLVPVISVLNDIFAVRSVSFEGYRKAAGDKNVIPGSIYNPRGAAPGTGSVISGQAGSLGGSSAGTGPTGPVP